MSASQHTSATRHVTPPSSLGYTFNLLYLLPSATKLRRLCFHRRVSVHGGGGCVWSWEVPGPGGMHGRGVPGPRGCTVLGVPGPGGVGIPACTEADPPRGETATAVDGTHPTGMHSCWDWDENFTKYPPLVCGSWVYRICLLVTRDSQFNTCVFYCLFWTLFTRIIIQSLNAAKVIFTQIMIAI